MGWAPEVAVEVALAPHAAGWGREEQLAVVADLELGFEHPGEGRGHRDDAAGVGLAVVGLGALEDLPLMGGTADLERLAVEVFAAEREDLAKAEAAVGEDADHRLVVARRFWRSGAFPRK